MTPKTWIERLEKRHPPCVVATEDEVEPDFSFRVSGIPHADAQRKAIQALKSAIADPRATAEQRTNWREHAKRIRAAIRPSE